MLFNSFEYLLFLPLVLACYWFSPSRFRLGILLIASYLFYMSWRAEYGLLLFGLSLTNYVFGLLLSRAEPKAASKKRLLFIAGLTINLATLAIFKYTNFFAETGFAVLKTISTLTHAKFIQSASYEAMPIFLPLGISFFVFEFIHYLVDVYKGQSAIRSPLRFGLFAAFFPSQIAGPIKRFEDFDQQALEAKKFNPELFQSGIILVVQGMFKKVALGDNLAPLVATGFSNCQQISCIDAWTAVIAFSLQIYYDFSGYTDIGRGSANLLGYQLPENFKMPYIARSVSEFWHRWHISLSTWLRDYLYIPLGGSRHGKLVQMRNLIITMLLGGLWHGASWTFIFWGAYHGIGLVVCHSWEAFAKRFAIFQNNKLSLLRNGLSMVLTFLFVIFGWVLFRAENMQQFCLISFAMLGAASVAHSAYDLQVLRMFTESPLPLAFGIYASLNLLQRLSGTIENRFSAPFDGWLKATLSARIVAVAAFAILILGLAPRTAVPFIYFQF